MDTPLSVLLKDKGYAIYSIGPEQSAYDSAVKMKKLGVGALLVIADEQLKGIISERDILLKLVGCACDPAQVSVKDIMTKDIVTVTPKTTVQEAMFIVTERRFRHLPVIEGGKVIGMISIGDLTRWVMLAQDQEISHLTGYIRGEVK